MESVIKKIPKARFMHILPIIIIVNVFYMMDRQVISIALPGGMAQGIALGATMVGFVSGINAIGMLLLQVNAGKWAQQGMAKKVVAISILCWSLLSAATFLVHNSTQLIILRFALGVSEGVVMPSMTTLLTYWFPDKDGELNRAMSSYFTGNIIAMVIMGPLAGLLITAFGWRIMFLILGAISLLCCLIWVAFINERPADAKWLSAEERDYIVSTINEEKNRIRSVNNIDIKGDKLPLGKLLTNKYCLLMLTINLFQNIGLFGFTMWMPTMLKTLTKTNILNVGLLTMLPNIATFIGLWCFSYLTKKSNSRRLMAGLPALLFGTALITAQFVPKSPVLGVFMITLVGFFSMAGAPANSTLVSLLFPKELDGPVRGMCGVAAGIGSFVGPYLVGILVSTFKGSTTVPMIILSCILILIFVVAMMLPKGLGSHIVSKVTGPTATLS